MPRNLWGEMLNWTRVLQILQRAIEQKSTSYCVTRESWHPQLYLQCEDGIVLRVFEHLPTSSSANEKKEYIPTASDMVATDWIVISVPREAPMDRLTLLRVEEKEAPYT